MEKLMNTGKNEVNNFMMSLNHPMKNEIEVLRKLILASNQELTEKIKWNAPSYCFRGDDRITFNLQGKGFIRLIFHTGAKVKVRSEKRRILNELTEYLEWAADDRAILKFTGIEDIYSKEKYLTGLINLWIEKTQ